MTTRAQATRPVGEPRKTHTFANGDRMPLLGLGTWKSGPGEVGKAVREAIQIGYRHIHCASFYGNEAEIGQALRDAFRDGDVKREDLWITSMLWNNCHGRKNVEPAVKKTLTDLGLDYLDMYLIHWPIALKPTVPWPSTGDDFMLPSEAPLHATWEGFEAAVASGLTRHIGVSNFSVKKLGDLLPKCTIRPEANQVELHPFLQQPALVSYCASQGIHITAYSPLGSGDRPGFLKAPDAPTFFDNPVIRSIAETHACTPAQVLLAWHVQRGISTIPKSVTPARLRENLAATGIELTNADLERIAGLDQGYRLISGAFWAIDGSPWTLEKIWDEPLRA